MEQGEYIARKFHEVYERLAPEFGYETRTDTREFDPESKNGRLMIAVCGALLDGTIELVRTKEFCAAIGVDPFTNRPLNAESHA